MPQDARLMSTQQVHIYLCRCRIELIGPESQMTISRAGAQHKHSTSQTKRSDECASSPALQRLRGETLVEQRFKRASGWHIEPGSTSTQAGSPWISAHRQVSLLLNTESMLNAAAWAQLLLPPSNKILHAGVLIFSSFTPLSFVPLYLPVHRLLALRLLHFSYPTTRRSCPHPL